MKKSTRQKGTELEMEFAAYMEKELGFEDTILNSKIAGKISTNEYEVDILGSKLSAQGKKQKEFGIFLFVVSIVAFALGMMDVYWLDDTFMFIICGGLVISGVVMGMAAQNKYEHTWVECKNHQSKIGKDVIVQLNSKINDTQSLKDKKHAIHNRWLVSSSGFVPNSLRFANEHGITCYEKVGEGKFEIVTLKEVKS